MNWLAIISLVIGFVSGWMHAKYWPQQRRDDWADGYEFARSELIEERTACPGCDVHPEMRRFVSDWEPVSP